MYKHYPETKEGMIEAFSKLIPKVLSRVEFNEDENAIDCYGKTGYLNFRIKVARPHYHWFWYDKHPETPIDSWTSGSGGTINYLYGNKDFVCATLDNSLVYGIGLFNDTEGNLIRYRDGRFASNLGYLLTNPIPTYKETTDGAFSFAPIVVKSTTGNVNTIEGTYFAIASPRIDQSGRVVHIGNKKYAQWSTMFIEIKD